MIVRVKLFAVAKQAAGAESIALDVPDQAVIGDVRQALLVAIPALAPAAKFLMFAVNAEYAGDQTPVTVTTEIACIPPVSGG
ncbi:MAG: MoaD/ThiS family protein [Pirellulales bacterium]